MSFFNFPTIQQGLTQKWSGLYGSSQSLALVEFVEKTESVVLFIVDNSKQSQQLQQDISFYNKDFEVFSFPDWEVLPYDSFSPHQDIISQRLKTLKKLPQLKKGILIVTLETLLQRICPPEFLDKYGFVMNVGDNLDIEGFSYQLLSLGYQRTQKVLIPGEFSIKGSIIDVFAMGAKQPFRLDLFDEEIETIRFFDVETQRSIEEVKNIELLPAKEFVADKESIDLFVENYQKQALENSVILEAVKEGRFLGGIEFFLPLFFKKTATLFDYLPQDFIYCSSDNLSQQVSDCWLEIDERYQKIKKDRAILQPEIVFLKPEILFSKLKQQQRITIQRPNAVKTTINFKTQLLPPLIIKNDTPKPLSRLLTFVNNFQGRVLFIVESLGRQEFLIELLNQHIQDLKQIESWHNFLKNNNKFSITVAQLSESLFLNDIVVITEGDIFGNELVQQRRRRRAKHKDFGDSIKNLVELKIGDAVVHEKYGVGRYLGIESVVYDEQPQDFIRILYAKNSKLNVPITSLNLISSYSGASPEYAPLHTLGSGQWAKVKKKAAESLHDVAAELLEIYAKRESSKGFVMDKPSDAYSNFVADFPFEETPDQQKAIDEVVFDMQKPRPMDRLICGDVGFGKTEIAMRAAFIAIESGKQVVLLTPTTLLANQHYDSFVNRFTKYPVNIGVLSRFQTAKQQKQTLLGLEQGQVDIVIGTHKLLNKSIKYANLGLMIVDEEHRFGVKQKEKFKALKSDIDILTMTATPIPRTLNMALGDLKDLSIIATPPKKRVAIKTFVNEWNNGIVKEACLREVHRGGQIFILHNEIDTIDLMADKLEELLPNISLRIAHGQMPERELELVMKDFYHQRFQILLCTTIIETGIDIPSANTIIINNAQNFGLAQLHQLRGRVGRSHHQAYAYLMIKSKQGLTDNAKKRLDAISALEDLGAGFMLANHDLEIRGAGELLGEGQSGKIQEIGFSLYHDLLKRTIEAMKANKKIDLSVQDEVDIDLNFSTILPEDYIFDVHERLIFYKRIASSKNEQELKDIRIELIDRFGLLPESVNNLFDITLLKQLIEPMGIVQIFADDNQIKIVFNISPNINTEKFIEILQQNPQTYRFDGKTKLVVAQKTTRESRIAELNKILLRIQ
ncbi:Transcription-repair coupling factor [hydrothermal vent metagenome]|uniref:Transcription-repair coupling factor n=1 Tax=hydrothermal vent metagenome TaxID=652676 RepID=A0A1W1CFK2_9ZZZZ